MVSPVKCTPKVGDNFWGTLFYSKTVSKLEITSQSKDYSSETSAKASTLRP